MIHSERQLYTYNVADSHLSAQSTAQVRGARLYLLTPDQGGPTSSRNESAEGCRFSEIQFPQKG